MSRKMVKLLNLEREYKQPFSTVRRLKSIDTSTENISANTVTQLKSLVGTLEASNVALRSEVSAAEKQCALLLEERQEAGSQMQLLTVQLEQSEQIYAARLRDKDALNASLEALFKEHQELVKNASVPKNPKHVCVSSYDFHHFFPMFRQTTPCVVDSKPAIEFSCTTWQEPFECFPCRIPSRFLPPTPRFPVSCPPCWS